MSDKKVPRRTEGKYLVTGTTGDERWSVWLAGDTSVLRDVPALESRIRKSLPPPIRQWTRLTREDGSADLTGATSIDLTVWNGSKAIAVLSLGGAIVAEDGAPLLAPLCDLLDGMAVFVERDDRSWSRGVIAATPGGVALADGRRLPIETPVLPHRAEGPWGVAGTSASGKLWLRSQATRALWLAPDPVALAELVAAGARSCLVRDASGAWTAAEVA